MTYQKLSIPYGQIETDMNKMNSTCTLSDTECGIHMKLKSDSHICYRDRDLGPHTGSGSGEKTRKSNGLPSDIDWCRGFFQNKPFFVTITDQNVHCGEMLVDPDTISMNEWRNAPSVTMCVPVFKQ